MNKLKLFTLAILSVVTLTASAEEYKASLFGIKSDGITLNTRSIQKAIDFISEKGGGTLTFYVGRYLTGSFELKDNVTIQIREGAVLVATPSTYDYTGANGKNALIYADGAKNIGIYGKGIIDGQGAAVVEKINEQVAKGNLKQSAADFSPALLYFNNCTDVKVSDITLHDAAADAVVTENSANVTLSGLTVTDQRASGSAFVLNGNNNLTLENSYIDVAGTPLQSAGNNTGLKLTGNKLPSGKAVTASR